VQCPSYGKRHGRRKYPDALALKNATSNAVKEVFNHMVHNKAVFKTCGWQDFDKAAKVNWYNIEYREDGASSRELDRHILNLVNLIRGIDRNFSGAYFQPYFEEFSYRILWRNHSNQCLGACSSLTVIIPVDS
jgi:hypothetical protein